MTGKRRMPALWRLVVWTTLFISFLVTCYAATLIRFYAHMRKKLLLLFNCRTFLCYCSISSAQNGHIWVILGPFGPCYDMIRDAVLTCARKLTVHLIYCTELNLLPKFNFKAVFQNVLSSLTKLKWPKLALLILCFEFHGVSMALLSSSSCHLHCLSVFKIRFS